MKKTVSPQSGFPISSKSLSREKTLLPLAENMASNKATFYKWRQHYGGMETSKLKKVKKLEDENAKLKRMYSEQPLN